METILGVSCIKGEIHSLITLMRLNTRWSSKTYRRDSYCQEDPLIENFQRLNVYLEGVIDLQDVDCVSYVLPFYHLIISEQAGSAITSAALSSLSKFALYGFFSPQFPRVQEAMALIARCISHCVFEETDWESDELILMKLLELATLCFRCHASSLLSAESAWDVFSTCKSIHEHYRASKILRNEAESALVHLTLNAFSRASHMILKFGITKDSLFTAVDPKMCFLSDTKGISLILLNIVRVISTMMEQQQPESVKLALTLINVALEAGGLALSHIDPLVNVLCNDICRHLLRATQSDDLGIFSCALRVVFNLFMSMKDNMKVQLEVFLTSVHLRILNNSAAFAREELTLESLLEFCREPTLMQDLYVNYDCDVRCTNLFDSIIQALCRRATLDLISNHQNLIDTNGNLVQQQGNSATMDSAVLADKFFQISSGSHFSGNYSSSGESSPTIKRLTIIHRLSFEGIATILHGMIDRHDELKGRKRKMLLRGRGLTMSTTEHFMAVTKTGLDGEDMLETEIDKWCEDMSEADLLSQDAEENVAGSRTSVPVSPTGKQPHGLPALRPLASHSPSLTASPLSMMIPRVPSHLSGINVKGLGIGDGSDIWEQYSDPDSVNSVTTMVDRENEMTQSIMERMKKAELLRKRKYMKQKIKSVAESFNQKPMKSEWLQMACDVGLIERLTVIEDSNVKNGEINIVNNANNMVKSQEMSQVSMTTEVHATVDNSTAKIPELPPESTTTVTTLNAKTNTSENKKLPTLQESNPVGADPKSVAMFLKASPGLGKAQIGEFISKGPADLFPFHAAVLHAYVQTFSFIHPDGVTVMTFDKALRTFLSSFRLPGEAQCIDRIMEAFAGRYFEHLQPGQPFASADAVFILSFSTILLNTDLHNPQVPQHKKMTKEQFIRNNRGINDGKDLPREYLEQLYDYIKHTQIQVHIDVNEPQPLQGGKSALIDFSDPTAWQKMITKIAQDQAPAEFTPIASVRLFHQLRKRLLQQQPPLSQVQTEDDGSISSNNAHSTSDGTLNLQQQHHQHRLALLDEQNSMVSYHGDMFVTMSKQIFQCIFALWHHHQYPFPVNHITPIAANIPDDLFLRRILVTLSEYSLVCCTYDLYACFNATLQVSLDSCWQVMQHQRRLQQPRSASISSASSVPTFLSKGNMLLQRSLYDQWRREQPQQSTDLSTLLTKGFDPLVVSHANFSTSSPASTASLTFVSSNNSSIPISPSQISLDRDKVLWTDATLIKAEITFKVLLQMVQSHSPFVSSDTWMKFLRFLLWCRTRGALPLSMAQIDHGFFSFSSNNDDHVSYNFARDASIISIRYPPSVYAKTRFLTQDRLESGVYRSILELATQRYTEYHHAKSFDAPASGESTFGNSGDNNTNGNSNGSWFPSFLWSANASSPSTRNNDDYPLEYYHPENGVTSVPSIPEGTSNRNTKNDHIQAFKHLEKKLKFLKVDEEKSLFGDCNDMRYRSAKDGKSFRTDDWLLSVLLEHANLHSVHSQRLFIFPENDYISSFSTAQDGTHQHIFTAQEKDECRRLFQTRISAFICMLQLALQRLTKNAIDSLTIDLHPTAKAAHYQHLMHNHRQHHQLNEAKFLPHCLPSSAVSRKEERVDEDTETMGHSAISLDDLFPTFLLQQDSPMISFTEWDAMLILEWLSRFLLYRIPGISGVLTGSTEPSQHNPKEKNTVEAHRFNGLLWLTFGQRIIDLLMLLLRNESDVLMQCNLHLFLERCVVISFQVIHTALVYQHQMWVSLPMQEAEVMWSSTWKLLRWMQDLSGHVKEKLKDVLAAGIYATLRHIRHHQDARHHHEARHHKNNNKSTSNIDEVSSEQWTLLLSLLSTCLFTSEHDFSVTSSASSAPSLSTTGTGTTATLPPVVNHAREAYRFLVTELLNIANYPLLRHLTVHLVSSRIAEGPNTVDWSMEEVQLLQEDMKQLLQLTLVAMASHRETVRLDKQLQQKQHLHINIAQNDNHYGKKLEHESSTTVMLPVSSPTASSVWQTPQKISSLKEENTRLPDTPVTPTTSQIRGVLSFGSPSVPVSPASSKPASPLKQHPVQYASSRQQINPALLQQDAIDDSSQHIEEIVAQAASANKTTFRGMRSSIVQHQNNPHLSVIPPECTVYTLPHLYPLHLTHANHNINNHHVPPTEEVTNIWMSTALLFADWTGASHYHLAQTALQALEMLVCAAEEDEEKEEATERTRDKDQNNKNSDNNTQSIAVLSKQDKKRPFFTSKLLLQLLEEMLLRVPLQLSPVPVQIKLLPVATQATQLFVHMMLLHMHQWRQETMDNNNTTSSFNNERVVTFYVRVVTALAANLTLIPHQQAKMNENDSDSSANTMVVNTLENEITANAAVVVTSDDLLSQLCTMFRLFPLPTLSQPQPNPTASSANATSSATDKSNVSHSNNNSIQLQSTDSSSLTITHTVASNQNNNSSLFSYINPLSYIFSAPPPPSKPPVNPNLPAPTTAQSLSTDTAVSQTTPVQSRADSLGDKSVTDTVTTPNTEVSEADVALVALAYKAALAVNPALATLLRHFDPALLRSLQECLKLRDQQQQQLQQQVSSAVHSNSVAHSKSPLVATNPAAADNYISTATVSHRVHVADLVLHHQHQQAQQPIAHTSSLGIPVIALPSPPPAQQIRPIAIHQLQQLTSHHTAPVQDSQFHTNKLSTNSSNTPSTVTTPTVAHPPIVALKENNSNSLDVASNSDSNHNPLLSRKTPTSSSSGLLVQHQPVSAHVYTLRPHTDRYPVLTDMRMTSCNDRGNVSTREKMPTQKDLLASPVQIV